MEIVIVYIPSRNQTTNHYQQLKNEHCISYPKDLGLTSLNYQLHQRYIEKKCISLGLPFIDLTNFIKKKEEKGNHLYWNYDQHMKAKGYKLLGQSIRKIWDSF